MFAGMPAALHAAELLMVEDKGCSYCRRWHAEVGPGYPKTAEGRRAPLRRIDIAAKLPDGISLIRPATVTPTFIVLDDTGREVGRLAGYAGAEFFYDLLAEQLARLPAAPPMAAGGGANTRSEAAPAISKP